jgi:transcriptional regulator with XRE-family HTH domain
MGAMTNTHAVIEDLSFDFADRLVKSLRVSRTGVSEMAEFLGVSRATVANWTSGRTKPTKGLQRAWAMRAGVPYEWLATGVLPCHDGDGEEKQQSFLPESNRRPSHYKAEFLRYGQHLTLLYASTHGKSPYHV